MGGGGIIIGSLRYVFIYAFIYLTNYFLFFYLFITVCFCYLFTSLFLKFTTVTECSNQRVKFAFVAWFKTVHDNPLSSPTPHTTFNSCIQNFFLSLNIV